MEAVGATGAANRGLARWPDTAPGSTGTRAVLIRTGLAVPLAIGAASAITAVVYAVYGLGARRLGFGYETPGRRLRSTSSPVARRPTSRAGARSEFSTCPVSRGHGGARSAACSNGRDEAHMVGPVFDLVVMPPLTSPSAQGRARRRTWASSVRHRPDRRRGLPGGSMARPCRRGRLRGLLVWDDEGGVVRRSAPPGLR